MAGAGVGGFSPLPTNVMGLNEVKFQLRREKKNESQRCWRGTDLFFTNCIN